MRNLKKILALVLALMMALSVMVFASARNIEDYEDAADVSEQYVEAVNVLTGIGIFEGDEEGFRPQDNITRAEVATLVYRVISADTANSQVHIYAGYATDEFDDLTENVSWANGYIGYAAFYDYVVGTAEGQFDPTGNITGYQLLAILLRALGYDQNGEFEGEAWATNVAQVATQRQILVGFNTSLSDELTREEVAYLIWRTIRTDKVWYTPALSYLPYDETIGEANFYLARTNERSIDDWGRPGYIWFADTYTSGSNAGVLNTNEQVYATIKYAPVETYTTARRDCDIATDLGLRTVTPVANYVDGLSTNGSIEPLHTSYINGDNATGTGVLTEVYQMANGTYRMVAINTYFGVVTGVQPQVTDPAGHVAVEASITMTVYSDNVGGWANRTYETTGYSIGDAVEVTMLYTGEVMSVEPATALTTGTLTDYENAALPVNGTVTVGGTELSENVKFFYGAPTTADVGRSFVVYVDNYGNVLALGEPTNASNYAILDKGIQVTSGFDPYYLGQVVTVSNGTVTVNQWTVGAFTNRGANALNWGDTVATDLNCIVSYTQGANGYVLATAANAYSNGGSVTQGDNRILNNAGATLAVADASTVYVVETSEGVFAAYTGYANVPSIAIDAPHKIEVLNGSNNFADLVYIDAIGAVYAGNTNYAYIMDSSNDAGDGYLNGVAYTNYSNVVINGVKQTVKVANSYASTFATLTGVGVYLAYDVNGIVVGTQAVAYNGTYPVNSVSGNSIYLNTGDNADATLGYLVDENTVIWVIDNANGRVVTGTASDMAGNSVTVEIAADRTLEKVIIWDTIPYET